MHTSTQFNFSPFLEQTFSMKEHNYRQRQP